ncbi:YbaN family protein [Sphingomonas sp. BIUV-7]|uniref:YbaN family protein n=1 Tax=Sphingomonas natans TaxID=3063330 RepID=A0ABT8YE72_9SPHN|nr:YbaN family protein [Sphingomonas sp. BIUV-7]MDO6416676.1 YbaN family protein [Sphingomonas sp. BIUV-7]
MRHVYLALGILSVAIGFVGIFLPLLPTVPFMLLAAFFFARSNPAWERRLIEHPQFGPHILAWRERGAISMRGKAFGLLGLTGSAIMGFVFLHDHWRYIPLGVAVICGTWIATRPTK